MRPDDTAPHLRTFVVRTTPIPGLDLDFVRVQAQGFRWTRHGTLELWRRIPAGQEQVVADFESGSVVDVYAEADAA